MKGRMPDPALAAAAMGGDDDALDRLARAWLPIIYAWCHRLGGPAIDAEDAAHETLIILCRRIDRVHRPEALPSWLFGTCRRVIANHRRRAWVRRWMPGTGAPVDSVETGPGPERTAEARQIAATVWKVLDGLPVAQREVLVLCELEERSGSETAELLGIPLGTVKSRLRAAQQAFRAAFPEPAAAAEVG